MFAVDTNRASRGKRLASLLVAFGLALGAAAPCAYAKDKKPKAAPVETGPRKPVNIMEGLDLTKIQWPNPPQITRIKWLNYWSGEKYVAPKDAGKKKQSWMDRVSGVATGENRDTHPRWQLVVPNGVATDSKGLAYIADSKVRAIFIVDTETGNYKMIKNGEDANFKWLTGLTIDDGDQLFAGDSGMKRVMVFNPQHKLEASITEGLYDPGGMAVDNENRLLYVTDAEQDLVLVYDADAPHKLLRKIGKAGTKHTSTAPGEFAKPTGVAVDPDGNVYVADTWNNRIEIFDADGNFIRAFGKSGDGPGDFARPKGVAIDSDGHVWVTDTVQDRLQVFTPEGQLLIYLGGHGLLPGMFQSLVGITIDKNNRVMTTEQMPGRMQIFRYIPNADARAEVARREAEALKKKEEKSKKKTAGDSAPKAAEPSTGQAAEVKP